MSIKTIIYISFKPINQRYIDRFCLHHFIEKGYKIYHLDISNFIFGNLDMSKKKTEYSFVFYNYEQLSSFFKQKKLFNCITVCSFGSPNIKNIKIFKLLKSYNSRLVFFDDGRIPTVSSKYNFFRKLKHLTNPKKVFYKIIDLLNKSINYNLKFDYVFTSGEISAKIYSDYKPFKFNNLDYNRYLKLSNNNFKTKNQNIIFVDQNMANHPDFKIMGDFKIDKNLYYEKLNNFFSKVEDQFNLKVLIATHPSANYNDNPFNNRKLIYGSEIAERIMYSDFIITFFSTAINYAILKYKPILFINSKVVSSSLPEPEASLQSKDFSKRLNQNLINIDDINSDIQINRNIDKLRYDRYKYDYIVSKVFENTLNDNLIENGFKKIK